VIRLAERTWPEAARLAKDPRSVVLLPLGAIEQHGPHLPLLVDWLGAEELARRVAPHLRRASAACRRAAACVCCSPVSRRRRARSAR
jgi:creatinine amidohydrolase